MSRISDVIKNKNIVSKSQRIRRKEELSRLRNKAAFRASLMDEMRHIDILLNDSDVEGVVVKVPENMLTQFTESIFSDEMAGYEVMQLAGDPDKFEIQYKMI